VGVSVSVVIPWRGPEPSRFAALRWVERRMIEHGWPVVVSEIPEDEPWCKPRAILAGAERASGEILVINDADCWSAGVPEAVAAVACGYPWAVPHLRVHRLAAGPTAAVLAGEEPHERMGCAKRPYRGVAAGGILVVPRATVLAIPPDPRFEGWGSEDGAWRDALRCLAGMEWRRSREPLYHLHHVPQGRSPGNVTSPENAALAVRYRAMRRDSAGMRALIDEARVTA
jgi:hypothetical protein